MSSFCAAASSQCHSSCLNHDKNSICGVSYHLVDPSHTHPTSHTHHSLPHHHMHTSHLSRCCVLPGNVTMATQQIAAKTPGSAATVPINAHSSLGMDNVTCCAILTPVCMMAMTVFPPTVRHPALKRKWVVDHNSIDSYYDLDTWETTEMLITATTYHTLLMPFVLLEMLP